jgi:hypothetical protein
MVRIQKGAWHTKLNDYVYGWRYSEKANNLCPYFWGTILATIIFPFIVIPKELLRVWDDGDHEMPSMPESNISLPEMPSISKKTQMNIGKVSLLTVTALVVYGVYGLGELVGWYEFAFWTGVVVGIIGLIALICKAVIICGEHYSDWRYDHPHKSKPYKEKTPSMTIEYLKAWKKNHCPMLEWED